MSVKFEDVEVGQTYETCSYKETVLFKNEEIILLTNGDGYHSIWKKDNFPADWSLVKPKIVRYVTFTRDGSGYPVVGGSHISRPFGLSAKDFIACIRVEFEEGQFDD